MKITKTQLKQIIKEELENSLINEAKGPHRRAWEKIRSTLGYKGTPEGFKNLIVKLPEQWKSEYEGRNELWADEVWKIVKKFENRKYYDDLPYEQIQKDMQGQKLIPTGHNLSDYINLQNLDSFLQAEFDGWTQGRADALARFSTNDSKNKYLKARQASLHGDVGDIINKAKHRTTAGKKSVYDR